MTAGTESSLPELDVALLTGFGFSCRPDCGLCCFTSPRLDPSDEARLLGSVPNARVVDVGNERCIGSRAEGGACQFLTGLRCTVHGVRPAPCREFPVIVHIGTRLQANLVLSCPGLRLDGLLPRRSGKKAPPASDFESELSSVRSRLTPAVARRRQEAERRRRRVERELESQGRWVEEDRVRQLLAGRQLLPRPEEYLPEDPPPVEDGLERLPMYFDSRAGPVALAQGLGGWEGLELAAEGGSVSIGVAVPPATPPELDPEGERLLEGYLRYWLLRDCFFSAIHLEMLSTDEGDVEDGALDGLRLIASNVLARGAVRAKLRGALGARLTRVEVELGIRATDQDWLDRPTWGSRL